LAEENHFGGMSLGQVWFGLFCMFISHHTMQRRQRAGTKGRKKARQRKETQIIIISLCVCVSTIASL
jgi:hypothetical protein